MSCMEWSTSDVECSFVPNRICFHIAGEHLLDTFNLLRIWTEQKRWDGLRDLRVELNLFIFRFVESLQKGSGEWDHLKWYLTIVSHVITPPLHNGTEKGDGLNRGSWQFRRPVRWREIGRRVRWGGRIVIITYHLKRWLDCIDRGFFNRRSTKLINIYKPLQANLLEKILEHARRRDFS